MRFSIIATFTALIAAPAALAQVGVHCGTTSDATLSDCQALVDSGTWNGEWAGKGNVCHYSNPWNGDINAVAYNVACHGNCCVYVARSGNPDKEQTRKEAQGLLGCGDTGSNKINGLDYFPDGHGVCLGGRDACGDCFDDQDFDNSSN
ncbi:unnamed protein product [Somion occarium]|uniref:Secreted protein n=1 Tax=Somion occarium TaxID=3059160 RepID=A0ABP1CUF8_9APHY